MASEVRRSTEAPDVPRCPECQSPRPDPSVVCPTCGAPPLREGDKRGDQEIRTQDLEPYVTLRYIARLFKVLAVLMAIMIIGEIVATMVASGSEFSLADLIGRMTQLLVLAGLMWAGGDIALLLIDLGHDIRVSRILLGRINAEVHRKNGELN
ncbi:MAG TPA: hypothetical protein VF698_21370 [Thermoanaerobaculia bacterium]|jgi:hypothetical protein